MAKWIKPSTPRKVKFPKGINSKVNDLLDAAKEMEDKQAQEVNEVQEAEQVNEVEAENKEEEE